MSSLAKSTILRPAVDTPSEIFPLDIKSLNTSPATMEVTEISKEFSAISGKILDIVFIYSLNKFSDTQERLEAGRPKFLSVIDKFVAADRPVKMCLPAFPFKSANKVYKVLGSLPDKAEELALDRLDTMCSRIGDIYSPGAKLTIISDGLVYNDLLGIPDRDTWNYGESLRQMCEQKGFKHIDFSRLKDLATFPGLPDKLQEISYVANATNFRRVILNKYGKEDINIDNEIATNPDTKLTYLGYRRFLESDLQHIFPLGGGRTSNGYKRDVKYLAKQMLIRGYAFAGACKNAFPDHLRLSIHQSIGEHKVSMSLLNTTTGYTTPWHCCVALMADGEWISAPMGDFQNDPRFEVVHENGQPSYFRELTSETGAVIETQAEPKQQVPSTMVLNDEATTPKKKPLLPKAKQSLKKKDSRPEREQKPLKSETAVIFTGFLLNLVMALLAISLLSTFSSDSGTFKPRSSLLLMAISLAAFSSASEARVVRRLSTMW
ncbi:hypothetical protein T440DRAFT_248598 [Plenodomus tracheiphilus IPT5]|uniref:Pyoverdine/dityrosine biosynthesis protein n=1 Tax=Plenodomus tracheiphilus IPT5 TaxID=1408161 RepID=A0A6A7ASW0_9PLEO|nr:hypothetical protein T440DRAFT_248598 [Plenodomus tracheiphilus IPT5]